MNTYLPLSRIKTIIKSSADVEVVGKESTYIITRAAELFVRELSRAAYAAQKGGALDYNNVADIIGNDSRYEFLRDVVPKKITVREYLRLMREKGVEVENGGSTSEDSASSSSSAAEISDSEEEAGKKSPDVIIIDDDD